jgi:hypothetical protein
MQTSSFSRYKKNKGISIAVSCPSWFQGKKFRPLAPPWTIVEKYKFDHNIQEYTEEYYEKILNKLNPEEVYNYLGEVVLLCWEKPGEFCHRRLVANWFLEKLNIVVPEYNYKFKGGFIENSDNLWRK